MLKPEEINRIVDLAVAKVLEQLGEQSQPRGGRKPGALEKTTVHICEVIEELGGPEAEPGEVLKEILVRAAAGESPYERDELVDGILYERGAEGEITLQQLRTKVYSTKSRYFSARSRNGGNADQEK